MANENKYGALQPFYLCVYVGGGGSSYKHAFCKPLFPGVWRSEEIGEPEFLNFTIGFK